jgi:uncharacterized protein (UPF0548 family)
MSDTRRVFRLRRLTSAQIDEKILSASGGPSGSPLLLSIGGALATAVPGTFAHDQSRSSLGFGDEVFASAKRAFVNWKMFDLGWVRVVNVAAPIQCGQIIAVEVRALGFFSVNLSRILETIDSETQFGFLYSTTNQHVEQGEETFILRRNPVTTEVSYELEAVSRPRHFLARLGFPMSRFFQHRFARDSHRRMREAVNLNL